MTQPRMLCPGATYLVTRRTLRRTCLLRPDRETSQLYIYCLGITAARFGIQVHAVVLMSTHEHLIVTDPTGTLPLFLRELHRLVALQVKCLRKWEGPVWDHAPTSLVELRTPDAIIEKLAYLMANPVVAGLVRKATHWPGVRTLPDDLGRASLTAQRPHGYFCEDNNIWPADVSLSLTLPDALGMNAERAREQVAQLLNNAEKDARAEVAARGWGFLGRKRAAKVSPYDRARSWEPIRARNPTFAVGKGQRRALLEAVERLRWFRCAYREAMLMWRSGVRDVVFPHGTWALQWLHHVPVGLRTNT